MSPDQPRDWDKELAEIDRLMAKSGTPAAGPPARPEAGGVPPAKPGKAARPETPANPRGAVLGSWIRVLLGVALAVGLSQWPYAHPCGLPLFLYLGATVLVVLVGIWGAVSTWRRRLPAAHVMALLVVAWGLAIGASVMLPRIGYARAAATWMCQG